MLLNGLRVYAAGRGDIGSLTVGTRALATNTHACCCSAWADLLIADEETVVPGSVSPTQCISAVQWRPHRDVVAALDAGFYHAFRNVQPTGKRFLLGVDVSGSMEQRSA